MHSLPQDIKILPASALERFLKGEHPQDILDTYNLDEIVIDNKFGPMTGVQTPEQPSGLSLKNFKATPKWIQKKIAIAEDLHLGYDESNAGSL